MRILFRTARFACVLLTAAAWAAEPHPKQQTFATPELAAEALLAATERHDVQALEAILGPDAIDLVATEDPILDKNTRAAFSALAREHHAVVRDAEQPSIADLVLGPDDWPMPIPIVESGGRWWFDVPSGREEILFRRIGRNEIDAIEVCRGYVEAQLEYSSERHDGFPVNQYAQRIVSTPGRRDGLAWRDSDGTWQGPVGEGIARAIAEGYTDRYEPYHGYYFKVLKGQGAHAPLGELDYVVQGAMIGGFALVAAPADYRVTGVKTFIVSHDGVVYERDLGPETVARFRAMERFDPDPAWTPVDRP